MDCSFLKMMVEENLIDKVVNEWGLEGRMENKKGVMWLSRARAIWIVIPKVEAHLVYLHVCLLHAYISSHLFL